MLVFLLITFESTGQFQLNLTEGKRLWVYQLPTKLGKISIWIEEIRPNEFPCRWKSKQIHSAWQQPAGHRAQATRATAFCSVKVSEGTWDGDGVILNSEGILIQYIKHTHAFLIRKDFAQKEALESMNFGECWTKLQSWASSTALKPALTFCCGPCYPEFGPVYEAQITVGEIRNHRITTGYRGKVYYFEVFIDNYINYIFSLISHGQISLVTWISEDLSHLK